MLRLLKWVLAGLVLLPISPLIALLAALGFGAVGPASAHDTMIAHYHVGERQAFQGLVCKTRQQAMHIFNTWMESSADAARGVFQSHAAQSNCKYLVGYYGYFRERLISSVAFDFNGKKQNVIVFKISPNEQSAIVSYVVTWENIGQAS